MMENDNTTALTPRAQQITEKLHLTGRGIEYGPLHAALLTKPQFDVLYVDYADRKFLRTHYANDPQVDIYKIPEIDIVTNGKEVSSFLPENSLDYVVASHVMEHIPDILGWLETNLQVLRPGGRIAVAYPDKRYCFDLKRKSNRLSDVIAAHLSKKTRPSFEVLCDHFWNIAEVSAVDCWEGKATPENAPYLVDREQVLSILESKVDSPDYTDAHCWVFTDQEFLDTMRAARQYSKFDYEVIDFQPTQRNTLEFYVTFERR